MGAITTKGSEIGDDGKPPYSDELESLLMAIGMSKSHFFLDKSASPARWRSVRSFDPDRGGDIKYNDAHKSMLGTPETLCSAKGI